MMTKANYPKSNVNICLNDIKTEFESYFSNKNFENIGNLGLQKEFKEKLKSKCEYYNKHLIEDKESDDIDGMFKENDDLLNSIDIFSDSGNSHKSKNKFITKLEIVKNNNNEEEEEVTCDQNKKNNNGDNHCCFCVIF